MEPKKYCAFISYRHQSPDDSIAKALHTAIETYHVPSVIQKKTGKKRLGRVFRDQEELPLSSNLGEDIQEALDESEWLIAICSPRYLESRWCQRELEYFIEKKGRDRVL
ncbi:MAG: toll/interleukin-1 receptor domain-containing protein, partial [Clostridia bacterium]|nr:toll/interleukin-1 receptor domain-containing protein [Clostridia bacterium]